MKTALEISSFMPPELSHQTDHLTEIESQIASWPFAIARLRGQVWALGIPSWLFGIADRSFAAFADGYISAIEIAQLLTAAFFFLSWLCLKPENEVGDGASALNPIRWNSISAQQRDHLRPVWERMMVLRETHIISQDYILPIPYLCQIYHLLNLKHLESVHSFSLSNLKVLNVSSIDDTAIGGRIKFQTVLESGFNVLRIWRQPVVEVDLTLHSPYSVELSIPVYGDKRITVLFNALPLGEQEHQFLIDIYSNLGWSKPVLQVLFHLAACLTLFEDLPYLQRLAQRSQDRLLQSGRVARQDTMQLYSRFVDLYGSSLLESSGRNTALSSNRQIRAANL